MAVAESIEKVWYQRMKKLVLICIMLLLLCGCGRTYSFTILDGQTVMQAEMKESDMIEGPCAVYTADGDIIYAEDYKPDRELYGVVLNPPEHTLTYVYDLALDSLKNGEKVMIVYLDGFGYWSYEYALENGLIKNLEQFDSEKVLAMYPTITPVNYAAMVTGQTPAKNGVTARGIHVLNCSTIFDDVLELEQSAYIAEGDTQILSFSVSQELNPDLNGDGSTDDEVFESALEACTAGNYGMVFVHFHGIDDVSHATGPMSERTLEEISRVDEYIGLLTQQWNGRIIVTADHGQHNNDGNGDSEYEDYTGVHGAFVQSDIYVPILTNWKE